MTYAISDIHGRFDKYSLMPEKINFGEDDTLNAFDTESIVTPRR